MFTVDSRLASCRLHYMDVQQVQRQQAALRQEIATKGLRLEEALKGVGHLKLDLRDLAARGVAVGLTEVEIARLAGVARSTVREWLGKKT